MMPSPSQLESAIIKQIAMIIVTETDRWHCLQHAALCQAQAERKHSTHLAFFTLLTDSRVKGGIDGNYRPVFIGKQVGIYGHFFKRFKVFTY